MMLAFAIDQLQAHGCTFFQQAWQAQHHTKRYLWEKMRAFFGSFYLQDWAHFFAVLINGPALSVLLPDTS